MGRAVTSTLRLRGTAPRAIRADADWQPAVVEQKPAINAGDPRWVLAMRVREAMQGQLLAAESRDRLMKIGQLLGLTAFESNLVIAIVQDQARRGGNIHQAAPSLAMVPRHGTHLAAHRQRRIVMLTVAAIAVEVALMFWLFA